MAFCKMCGAELPENAVVCHACGNNVNDEKNTDNEAKKEKSSENDGGKYDFTEKFEKMMDTPDTTVEYELKDIEENKILSIVSYISLLFFIPYFLRPKSKYARFHCNQGLVLCLINFACNLILGKLSLFSGALGLLGTVANSITTIICFALSILGIVNTCNGKAKELPIIGKIRIIK